MAYSHGREWNDEMIITEIQNVMRLLEIDRFPTHKEMNDTTGNSSLSNKVSRSGGTCFWSSKLELTLKQCETNIGLRMEEYCSNELILMGFDCELMTPRFPYDITANKHIKIDVKSGFIYNGPAGSFFTFNLEKRNPTCDIYVAYCMNDNNSIAKTYIIPSKIMQGKTQLSVGISKSKYDKYIEKWDIFNIYDDFYNNIS